MTGLSHHTRGRIRPGKNSRRTLASKTLRQLSDGGRDSDQRTNNFRHDDLLRRSVASFERQLLRDQINPQTSRKHFDGADAVDVDFRRDSRLDQSHRRDDPCTHDNDPALAPRPGVTLSHHKYGIPVGRVYCGNHASVSGTVPANVLSGRAPQSLTMFARGPGRGPLAIRPHLLASGPLPRFAPGGQARGEARSVCVPVALFVGVCESCRHYQGRRLRRRLPPLPQVAANSPHNGSEFFARPNTAGLVTRRSDWLQSRARVCGPVTDGLPAGRNLRPNARSRLSPSFAANTKRAENSSNSLCSTSNRRAG